jgi:hypothetical protein
MNCGVVADAEPASPWFAAEMGLDEVYSCASSSIRALQERLKFLWKKRSPAIIHDHPGI